MHALTHKETRQGWRTLRCEGACLSASAEEIRPSPKRDSEDSQNHKGKRKNKKQKRGQMKPALGSRPLPVAGHCRRRPLPIPRRCRCSAEARGEDEDEEPSKSQSSPSSPSPPRPPPPDPEKRWRRLWGGNPHGVYRVPGVSDWFARAPQVRVRSRTDRQVREKERMN